MVGIETTIEVETVKIDLEENIERIDLKVTDLRATDHRVIDREAIAHTGIDHHFVVTTAATDRPIVVTTAAIVPLIAETTIDPKAIDLLTEETTTVRKVTARRTKVVAEATDLLTEEETDPKVTDPHIAAAAVETDHRIEVVVEIGQVAAAGSDPAAAAGVQAVAVADLGPAAAVEDHHSADQAEIAHPEEISIKPVKKARTTKPKQQV